MTLYVLTAWKMKSVNFAFTEFSEAGRFFGTLMCFVPWSTDTRLRHE